MLLGWFQLVNGCIWAGATGSNEDVRYTASISCQFVRKHILEVAWESWRLALSRFIENNCLKTTRPDDRSI
ncbi:hypothetical protein BT93_C2059 [Corymbia citriodora subsp. variegata]|nr:hypothetical protein BT93_C2059 [Corymbia citriodora subsp. variegata]